MTKSNLYKRLGDYIELIDIRNSDLKYNLVKGISTQKIFIETKANLEGVSLHNYKIVEPNQFAYVQDTSRRGDKIALALNREKNTKYLISSIYTAFQVNDGLLPEYLYLFFNRPEFDRYARYNSWGSARETFSWDDLCDTLIPIPSIEEQKRYVAIYNAILNNQATYEDSLEDLQLICDTYIDELIKSKGKSFRLGDYIERITEKNREDKYDSVIGISERKEFREPSGKVNRRNLTNHLIVRTNEFAFIPRMNPFKPLAVALSHYENPVLVSPSYEAFRITKPEILMPEYLFLFLRRAEFDRYAAYNAWSSTRDTFDWPDMCDVMLPIPSIEKQKAIVTIYHTLETRKRINETLKESLQPLCSVLMRGVVGNEVK